MSPGVEHLPSTQRRDLVSAAGVRISARTFPVPAIRDGAIVGRKAPLSLEIVRKVIGLLHPQPFAELPVEDEVIAAIFVRRAILRRVSAAKLQRMIFRTIRPVMDKSDILALLLEVEVCWGQDLVASGGSAKE